MKTDHHTKYLSYFSINEWDDEGTVVIDSFYTPITDVSQQKILLPSIAPSEGPSHLPPLAPSIK